MLSAVKMSFELDKLIAIIRAQNYHRIALQFPDDLLENCVDVCQYLEGIVNDETVEFFVISDSTWGSSVDDVSAMHYNSDLLVYFGSDLSSSGSVPVIIMPPIGRILDAIVLKEEFLRFATENRIDFDTSRVLIFYEAGYHQSITNFSEILNECHVKSTVARLPACAELALWTPNTSQSTADKQTFTCLGGLFVSKEELNDPNVLLLYIGEKNEQLVSIYLSLGSRRMVCCNPKSGPESFRFVHGDQTIEFRERFGGVMKVKDAQVIGLIVGSMGLDGNLTRGVVSRLQTLLAAAHKKCYTFVMGRLNEAKLCNFPEMDLYCLICNDDNALIKPK